MPETQVAGDPSDQRDGRSAGESVADEVFDRIARLAHRHLDVPAAAIVMLSPDGSEKMLPGAVGFPAEAQRRRLIDLEKPLTAMVARSRAPLVVHDADDDPRVDGRHRIGDLLAAAYAGYPVEDARGHVVGALWAVASEPRTWTDSDLDTLADLAAACSGELRLRAERERARLAEQVAFRAHRRSRFLLGLSERFARVTTLDEVEDAIAHVVGTGTGARWVSLALVDADRRHLTFVTVGHQEPGTPQLRSTRLDEPRPDTHVVHSHLPLRFRDHAEMVAAYPQMEPVGSVSDGARSFLPVSSNGTVIGVIACVWATVREHDAETAALESTISRYVALALERVALLEARRRVATTLQESLLTEPPAVAHLDIATTYATAARTDQVGGDWYDAVVRDDGTALVMIGDVAGHDVHAAAQMGQLRSMLRALAWSHDESPADLLGRLDKANARLGPRAMATAVVARLDRDPPPSTASGPVPTVEEAAAPSHERAYTATWSSAGHPPPMILRRDGSVERLDGTPDLLLGVVPSAPRADRTARLLPGDTLVLYTDGLVERRGVPSDERLAELERVLAGTRGEATSAVPRALVRGLVGNAQRDDVAVLALRVRVPAPSGPPSSAGPARAERRVQGDDLSDLGPARRWVDDVLESCGVDDELRRTAMLLTSEVLTNALEHGEAPITATVEVDDRHLRVAVRDGSTAEPELQEPTPHDLSGRGVLFLDRLAARWGVERHDGSDAVGRHSGVVEGKTVWFEIERSARPLTGAVPRVRQAPQTPPTGAVPLVERVLDENSS
ncbi:SpoIIE family protein phosphatase [Isoptericola sp. BMS4]|uniref:SpoIIE family protein phosphatase n=1 Tax=Isoptericola sp. BMS4 TaxID=2527875 RepID=UPI001F10720C|nr:SpoIIE family protein phosphatase [Isoptericola sp. BMS4]